MSKQSKKPTTAKAAKPAKDKKKHAGESPRHRLHRYEKAVARINELEPELENVPDDELPRLIARLRERAQNGEPLDALLPETFAIVRETSKRVLGMRHFDVQLMGAMALHEGCIAEMKTGEGKTLVATAAAVLNALPGKAVHVVTVNDYLAKRDATEMGQVYKALGLTVGLLQNPMKPFQRVPEYKCDIIYGTNTEFGFDYLRDNMVPSADARVQTGFHYAIVDEVDSILIDEARTPLIISGKSGSPSTTYADFAYMAAHLPKDMVQVDEAKQTVFTTEEGLDYAERIIGQKIFADTSGNLANHFMNALKAQFLFHRDDQYVVVDGKVKIVDEFTGRILEGRRYSEGLHQAIEAKEGLRIKEESHTLATVTLQNYFRMYDKLSGMTGTAMTDDAEFRETYHLDVVSIPTNRPMIRVDHTDEVYRTAKGKWTAVVREIAKHHEKGQPMLVGTATVEDSEHLSKLLKKAGISHQVLNAKNPEREAGIVAEAGRRGAVTISTNMAGRGTDIKLGGTSEALRREWLATHVVTGEQPEPWQLERAKSWAASERTKEGDLVRKAGGLYVIGTERSESRRVDNQLRGRSGRQGDPGESRFFISMDDKLIRLFGDKHVKKMKDEMIKQGIPEDEPVTSKALAKVIQHAQMKVEQIRFDARKNVLDYDDVLDVQRRAIYAERNRILDGKDLGDLVVGAVEDLVKHVVADARPQGRKDHWKIDDINSWAQRLSGTEKLLDPSDLMGKHPEKVATKKLQDAIYARLSKLREFVGDEMYQSLLRAMLLRSLDNHWVNHLIEMDVLKNGIGLRGMAQRDPKAEYKDEAYRAFGGLVDAIYRDWLLGLAQVPIDAQPEMPSEDSNPFREENRMYSGSGEGQIAQDFAGVAAADDGDDEGDGAR